MRPRNGRRDRRCRRQDGPAVIGTGLAAEHRAALLATRRDDLRLLLASGISQQTIATLMPAVARIAVAGDTYELDPAGGSVFLLAVRVDNPLTPEAADPAETVRAGSIVDLLAFHPAHPCRWALRRDAAEWLGAIEPQYLDPPPVPFWRSPLTWLRAGCRGLVMLSPALADRYRILTGCCGGIVAEDEKHAAELRATLARPWPLPRIIVPEGPRCAA